MNRKTLTVILLGMMTIAGVTFVSAQTQFESLFNGKDLAGWEGIPELWKVVDGQIVGTTAGNLLEVNTFLIHKDLKVADFHLKAKLKMLGESNSGIMYRAQPIAGIPFALSGPQLDIHPNAEFMGMYYSEKTGRGIVARRGQKVTVPPELNAKGKTTPKVTVTFPVEPVFNPAEWNEYEIIAVGNRLIHKINGVVTVDVDDRDPGAASSGAIGFQLHRGPEMTIFVKDVEVAHLDGANPAVGGNNMKPYVGHWALHRERGAGWLELRLDGGQLAGSLLWGGGSVTPLSDVQVEGDHVVLIRQRTVLQKKTGKKVTVTSRWEVRLKDGQLAGKVLTENPKTKGEEFIGKRLPPPSPAPNLSSVRYAEAIELFNGKDLTGWESLDERKHAFKAVDGVLVCNPVQPENGPHVSYGNLKTTRTFEDFRLSMEFNVPEGSNSGVYLRGIYEIQIFDSFGKPLDSHNTGGLYSRITPLVAAEKPAGQWQTLDMTLCDRHLTVILNGTTIIDNQPVQGVTGGALTADEFSPGPVYLQGDHGAVKFRNLTLRPIIND